MVKAVTPYGNFYYYENDAIGNAIARGQFWDEALRPYYDMLGPGDAYVDVGANIGFLAVYAAKRGAYVTAFEASVEVFQLLEANVKDNGLEGSIRVENVALYDKEIELTLNPEWNDWPKLPDGSIDYAHHNNSGGLSLIPGVRDVTKTPYTFKAETLDRYGLGPVRLLKVDVQGADLRVLEGAIKTITRYRPVICCELEPMPARLHGDTEQMYYDFFLRNDYNPPIVVSTSDYGCKNFAAISN